MEPKRTDQDPCVVYADIIRLPHHQSDIHPHMSLYDRAAQFAPFAALSGYDEMVAEEARYTEPRRELSEEELELLNRKLGLIQTELSAGRHAELHLVYFVPDARKSGGCFRSRSGRVKRIDHVHRLLVLYGSNGISDSPAIDLDAVSEIHGELVDGLDEAD